MKAILKSLTSTLSNKNVDLLSILQLGINHESIDAYLSLMDIKLIPPEEVYTLYEWKNGVDTDEGNEKDIDPSLFPLGIFMSLQLSAEAYIYHAIQNSYWREELFPIFESAAGDYYLVECDKDSADYRKVFFFSPSNPYFEGAITAFDSLETLLKTVVECYENGAYVYDAINKTLHINPADEFKIIKSNNVSSDYWKMIEKK